MSVLVIRAPAAAGPNSVTDLFNGTENPLSSPWLAHSSNWTRVQKSGGIAYGTQSGAGGYDDSMAALSGFTNTVKCTSIISFTGSRSAGTQSHEVEHVFFEIVSGGTVIHCYEANIGYSGNSGFYAQIIKLNGTQAEIGSGVAVTDLTSGGVAPSSVVDGDTFETTFVTNTTNGTVTITSTLNGATIASGVDSSSIFLTRDPGIAFFWRGTENVNDFGFKSTTIADT